ncbi:conserved transmembrane protein [Mycolicibacterium flavescens]|nr:conserved transmembrane protein [Mycolicibacterium flavescens]
MERIWQWAWNRHGTKYSWALYGISIPVLLPIYLVWSLLVVAYEGSSHYVEAVVVSALAVPVLVYVMALPGVGGWRAIQRWAAGRDVDRVRALDATYSWARATVARAVVANAVFGALQGVAVGAIAGATVFRLVQYSITGAVFGTLVQLVAVHGFVEAALRPARVAIAGDTGIGDALPRPRPTFAAWSNVSMVAVAFVFAAGGAFLASVLDRTRELPILSVVIGCALAVGFAVPITVRCRVFPLLATYSRSRRGNQTCRRRRLQPASTGGPGR